MAAKLTRLNHKIAI